MRIPTLFHPSSRKAAYATGLFLICALVLIATQRFRMASTHPYARPYNGDFIPFAKFPKDGTLVGRQREFWDALQPGYKCPRRLLTRVGNAGDGGKWVCGLETLGTRNLQDGYPCIVYSFGVSGDSSFEAAVLWTTHCSLYAYDPTVDKIGYPLRTANDSNPRLHFQKLGIAGNNSATRKTLKTLMDRNGHKFIDILKMDVEKAEYESLEMMLQDFDQLPFGQLVVEFHVLKYEGEGKRMEWFTRLLPNLERRGARLFYVEKNTVVPDCCAELSLINPNYLSLFIPDAQLKDH